jgi:nucleoside 2-deoxyribosyltransferase
MKIYLAGPLFTEGERRTNVAIAGRLEAAGYEVYLPQRDAPPPAGEGYPGRIFTANVDALERAALVVAVCEGSQVDDGTAWEIGFAFGHGTPVLGLRTDSRIATPAERVNLMIERSVVRLVGSVDELLAHVARHVS